MIDKPDTEKCDYICVKSVFAGKQVMESHSTTQAVDPIC